MKIALIGAGKMATAIGGGIVHCPGMEIFVFDVSAAATAEFAKKIKCRVMPDASSAVAAADVVLLAVKPQYLSGAVGALQLADKLVISIVAGIKIAKLAELTGAARIVRVMPNTPAMVGAGAGACCVSGGVTAADLETAGVVLASIGANQQVPEHLMDAVTALSGSGPAYVFDFIMALADGGVAEGLPRDMALDLATRTVAGSAKLIQETKLHPAVLRDMVSSPAGTTIEALNELDRRGFRGIVADAVRSAAKRSRELGK